MVKLRYSLSDARLGERKIFLEIEKWARSSKMKDNTDDGSLLRAQEKFRQPKLIILHKLEGHTGRENRPHPA